MKAGVAIAQTFTGIGDFRDNDDVATISPGGPGEIVAVFKCPACGHSVTKGKEG